MTDQEKYAAKIAKLLRQAESTDVEAEADAFVAKAQQLMTAYAIDAAMLAQARGENEKKAEDIVRVPFTFTGIFKQALLQIAYIIAQANDCQGVRTADTWVYEDGKRKKADILHVIGFESDVENVQLLNASLQIQAATAQRAWWKDQDSSWMSGMEKFKARREFLWGFSAALRIRLREAREAGEAEAVRNEQTRTKNDSDVARQSVELVLRDKKQRVEEWMDKTYGSSLRRVSRRYSSGGMDANRAGRAAGQRANIGNPSVGGGRKELE